ncbi:MAG: PilZ domain-containing protein [Kofleriaceae bacterium]|nr:PilZ domain-containing protein [Myxococcales bacterium]MCB9565048.1 PilZ domain-containing protein [Kofleriaceae bacterium]MCB9573781.1 PilZ domain-containing protein [Kofleriaceae bacterium]
MTQAKRHDTGAPVARDLGEVHEAGDAADLGGDDRRAAPRVLVDLEVDYRHEDNFLFAYITDLSATGIFIRTTTPEPSGTHLNLRFTPPPPPSRRQLQALLADAERDGDGEDGDGDGDADLDLDLDLEITDTRELAFDLPLELEGEVIWVNAYRPGARDNLAPGMGIRFLGLDDDTKHRLYELVRRIAYLT